MGRRVDPTARTLARLVRRDFDGNGKRAAKAFGVGYWAFNHCCRGLNARGVPMTTAQAVARYYKTTLDAVMSGDV